MVPAFVRRQGESRNTRIDLSLFFLCQRLACETTLSVSMHVSQCHDWPAWLDFKGARDVLNTIISMI